MNKSVEPPLVEEIHLPFDGVELVKRDKKLKSSKVD
jgi:hypothetical protein